MWFFNKNKANEKEKVPLTRAGFLYIQYYAGKLETIKYSIVLHNITSNEAAVDKTAKEFEEFTCWFENQAGSEMIKFVTDEGIDVLLRKYITGYSIRVKEIEK